MRILWYVLTFVFAAIAVLAGLRTFELLIARRGSLAAQLVIAVVMLFLAVLCLRKARKTV